ncbi:MAG: enolase C-terminal domain-like protein [Vicinamibacterales bacterium]
MTRRRPSRPAGPHARSGPPARRDSRTAIDQVVASAYTVPTDAPESDGTIAWDSTTLVVAEATAGGQRGLGYAYGDAAASGLVNRVLAPLVVGTDAMDVAAAHASMTAALRNIGRPGVGSTALSAVDVALWDLKARRLGRSLASLLGAVRSGVPVYGSGGFTSYSVPRLQRQLAGWVDDGITMVKMKVGRDAAADRARVRAARRAIGGDAALFVDANGAHDVKIALAQAEAFAESDVRWFEEPVTSDDLDGLCLLRRRVPASMEVAAGEYGWDAWYFARMLRASAVDVLQADATRCGGVTGFLQAAAVCQAWGRPLSAHTAPHLHAHLCAAVPPARHVEYFHDHVRIERLAFDGVSAPLRGVLSPDSGRPGLGIELKRRDLERYRV